MTGDLAGSAAQGDELLSPGRLVREAKRSIAVRRALIGHLPPALVPDPALDFLTALYVAQVAEQRGMSRRELCEQTTVVANIAARWLGALRAENLIVEQADQVHLSTEGLRLVEDGIKAVILASRDFQ